MRRLKWPALFCCLALFPAFTSTSGAEYRLTPSIGIRQEYRNNIFLTTSDEKEEYITTLSPAINLFHKSKLLDLSLDYGLNFRFFAGDSMSDETSLSETQKAKLVAAVHPPKSIFFMNIFDEYERVPIDIRGPVALDNLFVNMTDSNLLVLNTYMEYPLTKTSKARTGYKFLNRWYKAERGNDSTDNAAILELEKKLSPKTTSLLSYSYFWHRPEETPRFDRQDVSLGLVWGKSRLLAAGNVGTAFFDFEEREHENFITGGMRAYYQLTEALVAGAGYSRLFLESVNLGTFKREEIIGSIAYTGKQILAYLPGLSQAETSLTVEKGGRPDELTSMGKKGLVGKLLGFSRRDTYLTAVREDREDGLTLDLTTRLTYRTFGRLEGYYSELDLLPEGEETTRYGFKVSLDYTLKKTTVSVAYIRNNNDSNIDDHDYRSNTVYMQLRFYPRGRPGENTLDFLSPKALDQEYPL